MEKFYRYLLSIIVISLCILISNFGFVDAKNKDVERTDVQSIPAFCYHDVVDDDKAELLKKNPYTITRKRLEEHFKLFKKNGFTPISMKQYEDYIHGKGTLPNKPILLSFDDGNESMYTNIYPLLQKYQYPAVFAIIISYMDMIAPTADIEKMVTWKQLKEIESSGLVTIASHTYNMHNFVVGNHYGDRFQNVGTIWWTENNVYQSEADFNDRIGGDMQRGKLVYDQNMGHPTNILVWPFGVYTDYAMKAAKAQGYEYQLLLNDDTKLDDKTLLSRFIIYGNPSDKEILKMLNHEQKIPSMNAGQVDIDMIYDELPEQFERNIDSTINKLYSMNVNTVFLQAFADEDGDGNVDEVYFHTDKMKVKADVFSHVTSRLQAAGFSVYAWMPVLSYTWMTQDENEVIIASSKDKSGWYKRATPFSPKVHEQAKELVKDLALYAPINGILFQDDLYMNDFEDFSPYAKAVFKEKFGKELTMENLQNDENLQKEWTKLKTDTINDLTLELIDVAKQYRPELKTARNIYPIVISDPNSQTWFAQNYNDYLNLYDYVIIMAYPEMEEAEDKDKWLQQLVKDALKNPQAVQKAVFKLQGYDWQKDIWIKDDEEDRRIEMIKGLKGMNVAQYPVNIFDD